MKVFHNGVEQRQAHIDHAIPDSERTISWRAYPHPAPPSVVDKLAAVEDEVIANRVRAEEEAVKKARENRVMKIYYKVKGRVEGRHERSEA